MAVALSIFGLVFAAFCVWLGVRIVNRRERWAKWTLAGVFIALAYPLSFGPACWIRSRQTIPGESYWRGGRLSMIYVPIGWFMTTVEQTSARQIIESFGQMGMARDGIVHVPFSVYGDQTTTIYGQ